MLTMPKGWGKQMGHFLHEKLKALCKNVWTIDIFRYGMSRRLRRFISDHPFCCFCGGTQPTTSIDHVPSRQMFFRRHRPQGLESPACNRCNKITGAHEQFAAMLARTFPDADSRDASKEIEKLMRAVHRQSPAVLAEMWPSWRQQYDFQKHFGAGHKGGALSVNGPLVNQSIKMFGAKLMMALHYHCAGNIVPADGGVAIKWFTNWDRVNNTIPDSLFSLQGPPKTLQQGNWSVPDQFEYSWVVTECKRVAHYVSSFRKAFLIAGLVHVDADELHATFPNVDVIRPGDWS